MIRLATPADAAAIEAFLSGHSESSMFLRSNLAAYGVAQGSHAHACTFWIDARGDGLSGVFALTGEGYGLLQFPDADADWAALRLAVSGRRCIGMNGAAHQMAQAIPALGLAGLAKGLDRVEPLMSLGLSDLIVPDGDTRLGPLARRDLAVASAWRGAYLAEILGYPDSPETRSLGAEQAERMLLTGQMRVLFRDATPVAMTGFNASLPDMVQIGAVFTPVAHRGRGHARRAVALHLAEARAAGVRRAVLFSANAAARRAYEAIGFRQVGQYRLVILAGAAVLGTAA